MISAIATTSTVASRWRRKVRPAVLRGLRREGVSPGGWLGLSVRLSTASLTLLIRSLRLCYAIPASADGTRDGDARPPGSSFTPADGRQASPVAGRGMLASGAGN